MVLQWWVARTAERRMPMRLVAIAFLAIALWPSAACANPIIAEWFYVDFDPPNRLHGVYPAPNSLVDTYLILDLSMSPDQQFRAISFRLQLTPGMWADPVFTSLLPGGVTVGAWDTGVTLTSTECVANFPAPIAKLSFRYLGNPGDVLIRDHPQKPRWVVDCADPGRAFTYCVLSHGGVGKGPLEGDCGGSSVREVTWTAIRALYR
jgi:hypothetical protein